MDSLTTKCRVVFDGSGEDSSGISLNDSLQIGHRFSGTCLGLAYVFNALCGAKMRMNQPAFNSHVWLTTLSISGRSSFGATRWWSSPGVPGRIVSVITKCLCGDISTECDSVDDLLVLMTELIGLLSKAKFKLRKWSSNCWKLLQSLPEEDRCYDPIQLIKNSPRGSPVKVLGIQWNPGRDVIFIKHSEFDLSIVPTKREL